LIGSRSLTLTQQIDAESAEHDRERGGLLSGSSGTPGRTGRLHPRLQRLWVPAEGSVRRAPRARGVLRALRVDRLLLQFSAPPRTSAASGFKGSDSLKIAYSLQLFSTTLTPLIGINDSDPLKLLVGSAASKHSWGRYASLVTASYGVRSSTAVPSLFEVPLQELEKDRPVIRKDPVPSFVHRVSEDAQHRLPRSGIVVDGQAFLAEQLPHR